MKDCVQTAISDDESSLGTKGFSLSNKYSCILPFHENLKCTREICLKKKKTKERGRENDP